MGHYFISRLAYYLSIFLGILLFSFLLFHLAPTDPARTILGPNADQGQVQQLREKLGLNRPLYIQFANYLRQVAGLKFGYSYVDQRNVFHEVTGRLKITLALIATCLILTLAYLCFVLYGFLLPSIQRGTDLLEFCLSSMPIFFSGVLTALWSLQFYPFAFFSGTLGSASDWFYLLPAALVLSFYPMAILSGILKKEVSAVLVTPFIMAEKSWGFSNSTILFRFSLRNALIPLLSALSNILPLLFTGSFIVEIIFSIPGVGSILVKSILEQDFPMLECIVIVNGAFFVLVNLSFEYLYSLVDPRLAHRR